jgi:hypothetical protein
MDLFRLFLTAIQINKYLTDSSVKKYSLVINETDEKNREMIKKIGL